MSILVSGHCDIKLTAEFATEWCEDGCCVHIFGSCCEHRDTESDIYFEYLDHWGHFDDRDQRIYHSLYIFSDT